MDADVSLELSIDIKDGEYVLIKKFVDEQICNPLGTWIDIGAPAYPGKSQMELIKESAQPLITTERLKVMGNKLYFTLELSSNVLCYFELQRIYPQIDRGFVPERIRGAIRRAENSEL